MLICSLIEANTQTTNHYKCKVEAPTSNIKRIKFGEFDSNIKLEGTTLMVKLFMENMIEINDKFWSLLSSDSAIYILDNSSIAKSKANQFDIKGKIFGDNPKNVIKNKDLTLLVNKESESDSENRIKELGSTLANITDDNYTLTCTISENIKYDLQSAMSIIDNDLLIINFDIEENENSPVLEPEKEIEIFEGRINYNKSKG